MKRAQEQSSIERWCQLARNRVLLGFTAISGRGEPPQPAKEGGWVPAVLGSSLLEQRQSYAWEPFCFWVVWTAATQDLGIFLSLT